MRAIIGIVLVVALLAVVGWVTFSNEPGRSSVNVETEKIERDIQGFKDSARQAGEEIRQGVSGDGTVASP